MNINESYPQRSLSIELLFDVLFVKCKYDTSTNSLQNSPWFFVRFLVSMFSVKFQIDCSKLVPILFSVTGILCLPKMNCSSLACHETIGVRMLGMGRILQ